MDLLLKLNGKLENISSLSNNIKNRITPIFVNTKFPPKDTYVLSNVTSDDMNEISNCSNVIYYDVDLFDKDDPV